MLGIRKPQVVGLLLLGAIAAWHDQARATVRIGNDYGGRIGTYMDKFRMLRDSGQRVEIDGDCVSACTLLLGYVPSDRICVGPNARLGFHRAWKPGFLGLHVDNSAGTTILLDRYPDAIRAWIFSNGGLSDRMIYLRGAKLRAIYQPCHGPKQKRHSETEAALPKRELQKP